MPEASIHPIALSPEAAKHQCNRQLPCAISSHRTLLAAVRIADATLVALKLRNQSPRAGSA